MCWSASAQDDSALLSAHPIPRPSAFFLSIYRFVLHVLCREAAIGGDMCSVIGVKCRPQRLFLLRNREGTQGWGMKKVGPGVSHRCSRARYDVIPIDNTKAADLPFPTFETTPSPPTHTLGSDVLLNSNRSSAID